MGWSSYHRDRGETNAEHFLEEMRPGTIFHATSTVGGVFYAAIERPSAPGVVTAYIAITQWIPKSHCNFSYTSMSEDSGPADTSAPASVLDALTPTTDPWALEWRAQCRLTIAQRAALHGLREGDQIVTGKTFRFASGASGDTFILRRQAIRGGKTRAVLTLKGRPLRFPNWQMRAVAVIREGERIDTPFGLRALALESVRIKG